MKEYLGWVGDSKTDGVMDNLLEDPKVKELLLSRLKAIAKRENLTSYFFWQTDKS
jgi:hypothetical protein